MPNGSLYNFQAYSLSLQLYRKVVQLTPPAHLRDQLFRAAQSITLNLAEGSAKPTLKDQQRFYAIAFGSIREVQACFDLLELKDENTLQLTDRLAGCCYRLVYNRH